MTPTAQDITAMPAAQFSLNGIWQMRYGTDDAAAPTTPAQLAETHWPTIPATVPGTVECALMDAGILPDLAVGSNVYAVLPFETHQWWYQRTFTTPDVPPQTRVELVFEGLDCYATIWLNDKVIGMADNMLIPHRFDVTEHLSPGGTNILVVKLASAVLQGRQHEHGDQEQANATFQWESLNVRKAPHMYGWDILPRIVSAGLWRAVYLDIRPEARIDSIYWATCTVDTAAQTARLAVAWELHFPSGTPKNTCAWELALCLRHAGRTLWAQTETVVETRGHLEIVLEEPPLWWPRGWGAQPLVDAEVILRRKNDGDPLDTHHARIGIRTVTLDRSAAATPEEPDQFQFLVNGEPLFIRGANWVALDALHSRDSGHTDQAMALLTDLNVNMVRCWGGSVYEDHTFFDHCDRLGILVWQDFALACAQYPQTDGFAGHMAVEADRIIRRLRNHPSLALWCGGNEMDEVYGWHERDLDPNADRITREVLPNAVAHADPYRAYLPNSPYLSPSLIGNPDRSRRPEDHLWRHADFRHPLYSNSAARFVSEIGFHGCPARASLEQMLSPAHLWPWQDNPEWQTKAVRPLPDSTDYTYRIALMAEVIATFFGEVPDTLDAYILASQIVQAEALKYFVERMRLRKGYCTGLLWWNLRDGWPVFSDAVVDYYFRPKLAYHALRRVQCDVVAMVSDAHDGRHTVVIVNDTLQPIEGQLAIRDADTGHVVFHTAFIIGPNRRAELGQIAAVASPVMWLLDMTIDGVRHRNHYLSATHPVSFAQYRTWLPALGLEKDA